MSTNLHDKRCRKPIGSRNNNTNTRRRLIQDLCSRFSYLPTSFLRAHHIISHSHGSRTDSLGLGPASELFRLSTPAKQTSLHISLQIYCQYSFLTILFSVFFFYFIQITRKKLCGSVSQAKVFDLIWLFLFSYCC